MGDPVRMAEGFQISWADPDSHETVDGVANGHIHSEEKANSVEDDIDQGGNSDLEIVLPKEEEQEKTPSSVKGKASIQANPEQGETTDKGPVAANKDQVETTGKTNAVKPMDGAETPMGVGQVAQKKKKRKKKPRSKRGLNAPSGFEEYYVDPPVTPAEHEIEKGLYHESISFSQRIETAIQRYCARRRLESDRKDVFDKYLAYGGINCGQKMFSGGLDQATLSDHTAQEIASMTATHFVPLDREDPELYAVDFERCAKAFFSTRMPLSFDLYTAELIATKTRTIRNFLNYLLHHDVAPEYREGIYATRATCDQAEDQLRKIRLLNVLLPGKFQTACSEIFGGSLRGLGVSSVQEWNRSCLSEGTDEIGITPEKAKQTFKIGLAAQATDEILAWYDEQGKAKSITTTKVTERCGLEITEIIPSDAEIKTLYTHPSASGLHPLGKVIAKEWHPPDIPTYDKPPSYDPSSPRPPPSSAPRPTSPSDTNKESEPTFEFFIEDHILRSIFPGIKLIATVRELSFGITYFDEISGVYCSFYDVLPNALMDNWVEPGPELPYRDMRAEVVGEMGGGGGGGGEGGNNDDEEEGINGDMKMKEGGDDGGRTVEVE